MKTGQSVTLENQLTTRGYIWADNQGSSTRSSGYSLLFASAVISVCLPPITASPVSPVNTGFFDLDVEFNKSPSGFFDLDVEFNKSPSDCCD
ncbi:hypothetical protein RRG08_046254 [Elysia crispata]|uniref:Uncharacterized protein n=1 Tax=Elysia crispata TaxID=231223 RepID=A0AAE1D1E6_9GAST|nr:hypothetical protein RRG08_046254 [Elysia crispata]